MSLSAKSQELFELYRDLESVRANEGGLDEEDAEKDDEQYALSQAQLMWRKFARNRAALVGGVITLLFYLSALFAPMISPYTLRDRFEDRIYMPPQRVHFFDEGRFAPFVYGVDSELDIASFTRNYTVDESVKYPIRFWTEGTPYTLLGFIELDTHLFQAEGSTVNLLGTDRQGRDMFSRIMLGSQVSLTIGLVGVFMSLAVGTVLGVVSGYFGGWVDDLIQRIIELVRAFPSIPLWMALSASVPVNWPPLRTYFMISIILSLIGWTWLARQLRGRVLTLRSEDYVLAARLMGASHWRVIFNHLIPASLGHIIVVSTLSMPTMILAETALSWLGLGLRPPVTSWGVLLKESLTIESIAIYPWVFTPVIFVVVAILAFNFLGDGLRDAADPYTR
ncbi:MAG: ABC transporter permease [Chloroflexota bacterium]